MIDVAAVARKISCHGQFDSGAVLKVVNILHDAFPIGLRPYDRADPGILDSA